MRKAETERLLDHLTKVVPKSVHAAGIGANSCILSTRLGVEALRSQRIRARALPVRLTVHNSAAHELRLAGSGDMEAWEAAGALAVQIGHHASASGWNGHLVVLADERYLVDLSAAQVQRLHRGITAEAFWIEARDLARDRPVMLQAEDDCRWLYEPTGDRGFLATPAWSGYRVSVRGDRVVSERTAVRPNVPVAPSVSVPLLAASDR